MPITNQDTKELNQVYSDWSETYGGQKEDYFACIYLKNKLKTEISDLSCRVAFGGNDYGIDAYHIDLATKNLYLFQFKWSEDHNLFKESLDRLTNDGLRLIFDDSFPDPTANEMLNHLMAELREVKDGIKNVLIHFVFKGEREKAEESTGLASRKENLENKRHLIEKYFGRTDVEFRVEFISGSRIPPKQEARLSYDLLLLQKDCVLTEADGKTMYVGFLPIMDLFQIYKILGQKFLDRNIRMGLSAENSPNKNIRKALADIVLNEKTSPDLFSFNHNGVTLAAEHLDFKDTHAVIKAPSLLNGAQTITSVAKFIEENEDNPKLKSNKNLLDRIKVMAKIVVADPQSEFVTNVTICNNRQNPVEPWNLRANDRIQCDLHDKFKEQAGVFYSRQQNSFNHYSTEELEDMRVDTFRDIKIKPLAQTFLAIQGEISRMYDLPQVFENQKWYDETFRETYLDCDARKIVIAYKIHLVSKDPMRRLEERLSQKHYNVISKGKHLVWSLLIQGIFNDPKLKDYLEDYGVNLIKEVSFREYLKTLASTKLVPILKEAFANEEYKQRIENEKYDFLRTKDFFNHCKNLAEDLHGWTKKSL